VSEKGRIRRVVVALDGAERTITVVREAARVASRFGADLEALLVEDEELLRLARLGLSRRVAGAGSALFVEEDLEREWRAVARQVRDALLREAEARSVRASFAVRRGPAREALDDRLSGGDLVVVGWGGWSPRAGRSAPIRVIWDGSESADHALDVGMRLAGEDGQLAVWIVPDHEALERVRAKLVERVGGRVRQLILAPLPNARPSTIREAVSAVPGGLLVVPAGSAVATQLSERSAAARFPCGVLVVR
jgi:nucleotide-binding universal stress UspA family protein